MKVKIHGINLNKKKSKISEEEIKQKIAERNNARKNKDYKAADKIRNELLDKGVLIEDKVVYRLPFSQIGGNLLHWFILKDIKAIFSYRRKRIQEWQCTTNKL